MSRAVNPFTPGKVALLLLVGAGAFLLLLYALGQGWDGSEDRNGGEHAASNGLTGFTGLAAMLENGSHEVSISRSQANFDEHSLLVLTPPHYADPEELNQVLEDRRYAGPTMLVLPKWHAVPVAPSDENEVEDGWVSLVGAGPPMWLDQLDILDGGKIEGGETQGWNGYGLSGKLPVPKTVQALTKLPDGDFETLVVDSEGDMLAGTFYPGDDDDAWPVIIVFEPDLLNNYGMADEARAGIAWDLVHSGFDYSDDELPITFDLTFAGLGSSENLLTLAFRPPFLAATLCLLLAALVIAWRSFHRFGPAVAQAPAMAQGKRQLALNGAAILGRVKRWHLLADPYCALIAARIAAKMGLREHEGEAREAAIDRLLHHAGHKGPTFSRSAHDLRNASSPTDILRAARTIRTIERTLTR